MKNYFVIIFLLLLVSCEEVVDVDLEQTAPRLVVEASLVWNQEKINEAQYIQLSTTAPFFDESTPPAIGGTVSVFSPTDQEYIFEEVEPGLFRNQDLEAKPGEDYELVVTYKDQIYRSTSRFIPTPQIDYIIQTNNSGLSGDDTEFRLFYTDPAEEKNFYFFRFFHEEMSLQIYDDEFTNGSQTFAFFLEDEVSPGDVVGFEIQGISQNFYKYLYLLRSQAGSSNAGPFQTQPTTVRGNIVNTTNPENFPFGYFRLSESDFLTYEVE